MPLDVETQRRFKRGVIGCPILDLPSREIILDAFEPPTLLRVEKLPRKLKNLCISKRKAVLGIVKDDQTLGRVAFEEKTNFFVSGLRRNKNTTCPQFTTTIGTEFRSLSEAVPESRAILPPFLPRLLSEALGH